MFKKYKLQNLEEKSRIIVHHSLLFSITFFFENKRLTPGVLDRSCGFL